MFLITASGRRIDPANPKPSDITIEDIASGLSKEERFDGNTYAPYTVAQHSCLVADLIAAGCNNTCSHPWPELCEVRAGLLHDASEAYIGDVIQPLKRLLPDYVRIERLWNDAIFTRFGLDPALVHSETVKSADRLAFQSECCKLVPNPEDYEMTREFACEKFKRAQNFAKSTEFLDPIRVFPREFARHDFLKTANFLGLA